MLSGRGRLASKDDLAVDTAVLLLTIVTLIIVVYPLIFVLSASVSEPLSVVRGEVRLLPVGFTLEGYGRILEYKPVWRGYANTIVYTVCGTIVSLVATFRAHMCSPAVRFAATASLPRILPLQCSLMPALCLPIWRCKATACWIPCGR